MGDGHATGEMANEDKALSLEQGSKVVVWIMDQNFYHLSLLQPATIMVFFILFLFFFIFFAFWSDSKIFGVV